MCLKKATKNVRGLRFDLGNQHRYPRVPECDTSLQLIDSRPKTAFINGVAPTLAAGILSEVPTRLPEMWVPAAIFRFARVVSK